MKRAGALLAAGFMALLATCQRDLYLGHDGLAEASAEPSAGQAAPPQLEPIAQVTSPAPESMTQPTQPAPTTQAAAPESMPQPTQPEPSTMMSVAPPAVVVCDAAHADCDGAAQNGCEVDLLHDRAHCGRCGNACQTDDCTCEDGQLTLHCQPGRADCDADLSNGCEANLMTSMDHCGACDRTCHANGPDVSSATCTSGECQLECTVQLAQAADCDGDPDNGCEAHLFFDAQNCGKCGNSCFRCEAGTCMF